MAAPAVAPVVHVGIQPGQLSDEALDLEAAEAMTTGRFDDTAVISDKIKDKRGGSIMAAKVAKYLFTGRSRVQHIFSDVAVTKVQP